MASVAKEDLSWSSNKPHGRDATPVAPRNRAVNQIHQETTASSLYFNVRYVPGLLLNSRILTLRIGVIVLVEERGESERECN